MTRYVHVPTDATHNLIRQAYEAGGPFQWAREGWRNSDESGANRIVFDVERQAAERAGVLRRCIIDNGAGMAPDDMKVFLTTFGGGGKPIGVDSNFGQGFKSSVLPWNPYGVVVISYTDETPDGAMLWIYRDLHGNYALKEWQVEDEEGDLLVTDVIVPSADAEHHCDWGGIRPDWLTTGTIMVLLGEGPSSNTIDGDPEPGRNESTKGLVKYLNSRLFDIPERNGTKVDTTVVDLERVVDRSERRTSKDATIEMPDGSVMALHQRKVNGMKHFIPAGALRGHVTVDPHGTVVDWYYVPEPASPVAGSADYIGQRPVVTVDYQGEAYHSDTHKYRYRQFGVTDEIMGRTWMIVRPPVYSDNRPGSWGVLTQASRNMLIGKGGTELPWEAWGDAFYANFPPELAAARDEVRQKSSSKSIDANMANLTRILDRLNARYKASRLMSAAMGRVLGFPTGERAGTPGIRPARVTNKAPAAAHSGVGMTGANGSSELVAAGAGGPLSAAVKSTRAGYPTYKWTAFTDEDVRYLADFNPKDSDTADDGTVYQGVVYLNIRHPVFQQEFDHWAGSVWPKADPAQVQNLVSRVYGEEAVAHVVHARRLNGTVVGRDEEGVAVQIGESDVDELISKPALSAALLGLVNVEQRILTQGGGVFGKIASS
jgi:hypothetical protein